MMLKNSFEKSSLHISKLAYKWEKQIHGWKKS